MSLFPIISLYISIISPYILDITENKGGLMVFVKSHIPSRWLNDFKIRSNIQIVPFEINLSSKENIVSCMNLQRSIPERQIFSQVFDKAIRILLNSVWIYHHSWWFCNEWFPLGASVLQYNKTEYMF